MPIWPIVPPAPQGRGEQCGLLRPARGEGEGEGAPGLLHRQVPRRLGRREGRPGGHHLAPPGTWHHLAPSGTTLHHLAPPGQGTSALLEALPSVAQEDYHVVMIGLDGAGKTTALYRSGWVWALGSTSIYRMKVEQYVHTVPTIGFNCERVSLGTPDLHLTST